MRLPSHIARRSAEAQTNSHSHSHSHPGASESESPVNPDLPVGAAVPAWDLYGPVSMECEQVAAEVPGHLSNHKIEFL